MYPVTVLETKTATDLTGGYQLRVCYEKQVYR